MTNDVFKLNTQIDFIDNRNCSISEIKGLLNSFNIAMKRAFLNSEERLTLTLNELAPKDRLLHTFRLTVERVVEDGQTEWLGNFRDSDGRTTLSVQGIVKGELLS